MVRIGLKNCFNFEIFKGQISSICDYFQKHFDLSVTTLYDLGGQSPSLLQDLITPLNKLIEAKDLSTVDIGELESILKAMNYVDFASLATYHYVKPIIVDECLNDYLEVLTRGISSGLAYPTIAEAVRIPQLDWYLKSEAVDVIEQSLKLAINQEYCK